MPAPGLPCRRRPGLPPSRSDAAPSPRSWTAPAIETSASQPSPAHGSVARGLALAIATGGGAGLAPVAPGTAGAALGAVLFWPLAALPVPLFAVTWLGLACLGVWAAGIAEQVWSRKDDGRIVVDEIAGQLVALVPLLFLGRARSIGWLVTGFVAFRVFDVWKPAPARWMERNLVGGLGVMMDDVMAGVLAAASLALAVGVVEALG